MSTNQPFGDLVDIYDALIDWPRRLSHEAPFYRRLFDEIAVQRLVDVACGTGHHAAMFHQWGIAVEGSDISPEMIRRAREHHGESATQCWSVRSFDQPIETETPFDAALCVGNSLALSDAQETVENAIHHMFDSVRPGGLVIVHVLNLWRLADGPCLWQKCRRVPGTQGEVLALKGVHRRGESGFVDLIIATLDQPPALKTESVPFLGLDAESLADAARCAGAATIRFFGGYEGQEYQREESVDLLMVAERTTA